MIHIANPNKAFTIRWVRRFDMGVLYCSCGYRNNFYKKYVFKCSECNKSYDIRKHIKDDEHIKRAFQ